MRESCERQHDGGHPLKFRRRVGSLGVHPLGSEGLQEHEAGVLRADIRLGETGPEMAKSPIEPRRGA